MSHDQISGNRLNLSNAIPFEDRMVSKRDGKQVPYDSGKILRAIALAFFEVAEGNKDNPHRDEPGSLYGLSPTTYAEAVGINESASHMLELLYQKGESPTIEDIQDSVERAIAAKGRWDVARSYVLYRAKHAEKRLEGYKRGENGLSNYIFLSKYARHRPDLGRRETYDECVDRVKNMHLEFFKDRAAEQVPLLIDKEDEALAGDRFSILKDVLLDRPLFSAIEEAFECVRRKEVLPSMRSMQFAGPAVLTNHARIFNCAFGNVDSLDFFRRYFFLLLGGCGVGFSVQKQHIARLPHLPVRAPEDELPVRHFTVEDTVVGWCDALDALVQSYFTGETVEFNYSKIRAKGEPLVTSGGKAPGHRPLKQALEEAREVLEGSSGRALHSIEIYDICMYVARAVLSGGIRRSATICLFSADDEDMATAKTGDWYKEENNPQRRASNNSAVIARADGNREDYDKLFECLKGFGEPGFYFNDNPDSGCNPCVEIALNPIIDWDLSKDEEKHMRDSGMGGALDAGDRLSGFQMCNLTTINAAAAETEEKFYKAAISAAMIGTLQAAYTQMPYMGAVTELVNRKDALLGVSICGLMDSPDVFLDPAVLANGAKLARLTNRIVARTIGINRAARVTCVKPEGTASLLLGAASGIHPHHAARYFRRVTANRLEPVYQFFKGKNPQMTESSATNPKRDDSICFPVVAPEGALLRKDVSAVKFLELVCMVQQAWVLNGTDESNRNPELCHNVSNTCTVKDAEWDTVRDFIWDHRHLFTGLSLLGDFGDKTYVQAPMEEVTESEQDIAKWNALKPKQVDFTELVEKDDVTDLQSENACAGGSCEIV